MIQNQARSRINYFLDRYENTSRMTIFILEEQLGALPLKNLCQEYVDQDWFVIARTVDYGLGSDNIIRLIFTRNPLNHYGPNPNII